CAVPRGRDSFANPFAIQPCLLPLIRFSRPPSRAAFLFCQARRAGASPCLFVSMLEVKLWLLGNAKNLFRCANNTARDSPWSSFFLLLISREGRGNSATDGGSPRQNRAFPLSCVMGCTRS